MLSAGDRSFGITKSASIWKWLISGLSLGIGAHEPFAFGLIKFSLFQLGDLVHDIT